jgi:hypothetical protein
MCFSADGIGIAFGMREFGKLKKGHGKWELDSMDMHGMG